jgi:hypothetical protein
MSVAEGVVASHVAGLRAMRDKLAGDMDEAPPAVVAQIAGQLRIVLAELATLEAATPEVSASDVIARDLAAGLAEAKVVPIAGRGRKRRTG